MRYQLRDCREEDRAWAYALKSEAYREVVERQFGPWDEAFQSELFSTRWNPSISKVVVIDGAAVGLIAVEDRRDHVWLDEIQICAEWRCKGVGTMILHDLISCERPVRLQVLKKNERAQEFYHRLGFGVIGETETHDILLHEAKRPNQSLEPTTLLVMPRACARVTRSRVVAHL